MLIEAHLAEGNWVEARRSYQAYRAVLQRELGVEPDPELAAVALRPARSWQAAEVGVPPSLAATVT
jgi:hypothetical protein